MWKHSVKEKFWNKIRETFPILRDKNKKRSTWKLHFIRKLSIFLFETGFRVNNAFQLDWMILVYRESVFNLEKRKKRYSIGAWKESSTRVRNEFKSARWYETRYTRTTMLKKPLEPAITVQNSFMQLAPTPRAFFVALLNCRWYKQVKETLQESNNGAIRDTYLDQSLLTIFSSIRCVKLTFSFWR